MIAVTGAAGFIGSNLAARLSAEGAELILVDHPLTPDKLVNWLGFKGFRFLEHLDFLDELGKGSLTLDAVFHLGACSNTTETDWEYLHRNNIEYSQRLWRWCVREGKPRSTRRARRRTATGLAGSTIQRHQSISNHSVRTVAARMSSISGGI